MKTRIIFPAAFGVKNEALARRAIADVGAGFTRCLVSTTDGRLVDFHACEFYCPSCGVGWMIWATEYTLDKVGLASAVMSDERCHACPPDPSTMTPEQRGDLVRRLAQTEAVHTMAVEVDRALSEGRTSEYQWHHPDDLAEIERLRELASPPMVTEIIDNMTLEQRDRIAKLMRELGVGDPISDQMNAGGS